MRSKARPDERIMTALLAPRPDKQEEFLQTLRQLHAEIREEPGCLECVVGREVDEGGRFLVFTVWASSLALRTHLESDHFRILHGAASVLSIPMDFRYIVADSNCLMPAEPFPGLVNGATRRATLT